MFAQFEAQVHHTSHLTAQFALRDRDLLHHSTSSSDDKPGAGRGHSVDGTKARYVRRDPSRLYKYKTSKFIVRYAALISFHVLPFCLSLLLRFNTNYIVMTDSTSSRLQANAVDQVKKELDTVDRSHPMMENICTEVLEALE